MTASGFHDDANHGKSQYRLIDECCDAFESAWEQGKKPRIEDYLDEVSPEEWRGLLQELLRSEWELSVKMGVVPDQSDYLRRFPDEQSIVESAWGHFSDEPPSLEEAPVVHCLFDLGSMKFLNDDFRSDPETHFEQRVFGDYELLDEVARGGMGVVYRARQRSLDRIVALKLILGGQLATREFVHRFRTEAAAAAALQHPNIVAIHEVGVHDGNHFFSMDYVEGQNLAQLVGNRPLSPKKAARYLKVISEAIHYAHEQGILHRDLKPSNVLVDALTNQPRVTDFGLAKRLDGESSLTMTGQVLGSPQFMPPEQASPQLGKVGRRSDVYALGSSLYFLLCARPPFQGESLEMILGQVLNTEPVSPRLLNPNVPRDLETVCLKCLEKEPDRRYQSAQAMAEDLSRFLEGQPTLARPITRLERTWRWCRRKPAFAGLVFGVVILFLTLAIGSPIVTFHIQQARQVAEANLYAADLNLANEALKKNNVGRALQLLDRHRPASDDEEDLRGWEWRYLWGQCQSDALFQLARLETDSVFSVSVSSDGNWLATGGHRDGVAIWDLRTRELVARFAQGERSARVRFSPTDLDLVGVTTQHIYLWNGTKRTVTEKVRHNHSEHWHHPVITPDGGKMVLRSNEEGSVSLWSLPALSKLTEHDAPQGWEPLGVGFAVSPDASLGMFVSYGSKTMLHALDLNSGELRWSKEYPPRLGGAIAISPDGKRAYTGAGGANGDIHIWDVTNGDILDVLKGHVLWISNLIAHPDGKRLISSSADQTIRIWDLEKGREQRVLRGHGLEVWGLALSPDRRTVVSGGKDGTVLVWDLEKQSRREIVIEARVHGAWISPDRRELVTAEMETGDDGERLTKIRLRRGEWFGEIHDPDLPDWDRSAELVSMDYDNFASGLAVSKSLRFLAAASATGPLRICDLETSKLLGKMGTESSEYQILRFSHDETRLWTVVKGNDPKIPSTLVDIDPSTLQIRHSMELPGTRPNVYVAADDQWAFCISSTATSTYQWHLLDLLSGTVVEVPAPDGRLNATRSAGISPDGKWIAVAHDLGPITVWQHNALRGQASVAPVSTMGGILMSFSAAMFSPDNRRLAAASGGPDGVKLWETNRWQELLTIATPGEMVQKIQFSADGSTLIGYGSNKLRIWRAPSWEEIASIEAGKP